IGGGGMGDVYLAEHLRLNRQVAIKTLRDGGALGLGGSETSSRATERFEQEARVIARLEHPHIVRIYDFGVERTILYMVMAYVPGGSLYSVFDMRAPSAEQPSPYLPLAPKLVIELTHQMAAALDYAHDQGVIHCDVKPQNILVRRETWVGGAIASTSGATGGISNVAATAATMVAGSAQLPGKLHLLLTDFGLARILSELTSTVTITGTPLYMAPEQATGHPVAATDQYSLACLIYLLLTGRHVFQGNLAQLHYQHLQIEPTPPTAINRALPPAVDTPLLRALAKFPEQRYARVGDFAQALEAAITGVPAGALSPGAAHTPPRAPTGASSPSSPSSQPTGWPGVASPLFQPSTQPFSQSSGGYLAVFGAISGAAPGLPLPQDGGEKTPDGLSTTRATGRRSGPQATTLPDAASLAGGVARPPEPLTTSTRSPSFSRRALLAGGGAFGAAAILGGGALVARQYGWPFAVNSPTKVRLRWRYVVGARTFSSPIVANGAVYFGADSNDLYALNAATGHPLWSFTTQGPITSTPAAANSLIYTTSQDGALYAVDVKTGYLIWKYDTSHALGASPVVDGQILYQAAAGGTLLALDASSGLALWTRRGLGLQYSTAAIANGLVCYGASGEVLALDAITGQVRWRFAGQRGELFARPLLVGDALFVGSHYGQFYALDATTGILRSQIPLSGAILDAPVLADNTIYVSADDGELFALRATDGERTWRFSANGRITHAPTVVNGVVYVGAYDFNVYALDTRNGSLRWSYTCSGPIGSIPAVTQDSLYVTSADGVMYALTLPSA
ncbi:MAG: PQQ-binding-like beta-propeller repeat protein, partial [Ktedonobacterales bacterium]